MKGKKFSLRLSAIKFTKSSSEICHMKRPECHMKWPAVSLELAEKKALLRTNFCNSRIFFGQTVMILALDDKFIFGSFGSVLLQFYLLFSFDWHRKYCWSQYECIVAVKINQHKHQLISTQRASKFYRENPSGKWKKFVVSRFFANLFCLRRKLIFLHEFLF